jgi:hypothetical protein
LSLALKLTLNTFLKLTSPIVSKTSERIRPSELVWGKSFVQKKLSIQQIRTKVTQNEISTHQFNFQQKSLCIACGNQNQTIGLPLGTIHSTQSVSLQITQ